MKVGVLNLNLRLHGESSAAIRWKYAMEKAGADATLFTITKSGKKLKGLRTDYPFECFGTRNDQLRLELQEFLDAQDVILSFGTGALGEDDVDEPYYYEHLQNMTTPLVAYIAGGESANKAYKNTDLFLKLPTLVGTMFLRDSIRSFFYERYDFCEYLEGIPYSVLNDPFPFTYEKGPCIREENKIVSAARIIPGKNVDKLFRTLRAHLTNDFAPFDLEVWGDGGSSRYSWMLGNEYPEYWEEFYKGSYDHTTIADVYDRKRFSIDLSNYKNDGGIQHIFMESVTNSALPIVMEKWNIQDLGVSVASLGIDDIHEALLRACSMEEGERLQRIHGARQYVKENHDPLTQGTAVLDYLGRFV